LGVRKDPPGPKAYVHSLIQRVPTFCTRCFCFFQLLTTTFTPTRENVQSKTSFKRGDRMHAIPLSYNDHVLVPLAAGERGSFASMVIVTKPNGARWASGVLGHFTEADDACRFAIAYGKAEVDGRRRPRAVKPPAEPESGMSRAAPPCTSGSAP
jgi:hypothetical protein